MPCSLIILAALSLADPDLGRALETVRKVGPDARGSREAAQAWKELAALDVDRLPDLLGGMDGASPLARNWLRSAVDEVLGRAHAQKKPLPAGRLEAFLKDTRHDPQARRFVYELLLEGDPSTADRFLPTMLDDPSPELRRDALARLLARAEKVFATDKKAEARPLFEQALTSARDKDQIDQTVRRLRELGRPVDLARHLGMVQTWKLLGPFPNAAQKGMATPYPPEKAVDFAATYDGKAGKVQWKDYVSKDEYGIVDVNAALGPNTEAVTYAAAEFPSSKEQDVELRLGCFTGFKLWVNGQLVLERGDAYTGMAFDHYVTKAHLKAGTNTILLKMALDTPPPQLPKMWKFQLRVCDGSGAGVGE